MKSKYGSIAFWWIISLIPILGIVWSMLNPQGYESTSNYYSNIIQRFGIMGWFAFILLQVFQVVITPFNHYVIGILGGFIFGPIVGGLYNWIGRIIGHTIAFFLARKYGRNLLIKYISENDIQRYNRIIGDRGIVLFLIYFLPFFPDDEISYLVGLSNMKNKTFLIAVFFGHIGGSWSLAYVGAGITTYDYFFYFLIGLTIIGFVVIVYMFDHKIDNKAEIE